MLVTYLCCAIDHAGNFNPTLIKLQNKKTTNRSNMTMRVSNTMCVTENILNSWNTLRLSTTSNDILLKMNNITDL